jgi:hypothetical protein
MLTASNLLVVAATLGPATAATNFAPEPCAYSVAFPAPAQITEEQGGSVSADLVRDGIRYSAACIGSVGDPTTLFSSATARIAEMAAALGVEHPRISAFAQLGPDCGAVDGSLNAQKGAYKIEARICIGTNATFIAEAIYSSSGNLAVSEFLESVKAR